MFIDENTDLSGATSQRHTRERGECRKRRVAGHLRSIMARLQSSRAGKDIRDEAVRLLDYVCANV